MIVSFDIKFIRLDQKDFLYKLGQAVAVNKSSHIPDSIADFPECIRTSMARTMPD